MNICKNCGHQFDLKFCPNCGQKASVKRIELKWLMHELPHAVWHVEKGFLYNFVQFFRRPGHAAIEYIEGRRKNYYHPVSYMLIILAVMYLVAHAFDLHWYDPVQDAGMKESQVTYWTVYEKSQHLWMNHYFEYMALYLPVSGLIILVMLRWMKRKYNYAESLIISLFFIAQVVIPQIIGFFIAGLVNKTSFTRTIDNLLTFGIVPLLLMFQIYQSGKPESGKFIRWVAATAGSVLLIAWLYACLMIQTVWLHKAELSDQNEKIAVGHFDTDFRPAQFTDTARLQKIKQAFPLIDRIFNDYADSNHLPGVAYGLVVDGKLVYKGNIGYTDIEKKIPVTSSSLFRIASMSKSFAAMAILKLRDEGKLNLDDPAYLYIPELKNLKYPTVDAPHITVRHLMSHSAGFPEDNPWGDRQLADTDKDLIDLMGKQLSFSNPPGIAYEYSNLGFALLGKIITRVSGMRYQDYIKKNILEPLSMKTTTYEYGDVAPDKLAHGYRWLNEKWNEETLLHDTKDGSWGAMGAMISSIDEFANYMAFHLSAWPPNNMKDDGPIKRSSVREMHQPWRFNALSPNHKFPDGRTCAVTTAYCFGLNWMKDCEGKTYIAHSGGLPGFGSQWRIMPDYGIGIVSFANRTYAPMTFVNLRILDTIIKIAQLQPVQLPPSGILQQRKNELLKILPGWNNAEQSGIFAENFFPDYPIDTLRKYAGDLYAKAGKIISVKEMKAENQLRGSFIIEGEKTNIEIYFTLSPENPPRIQEYHIREVPKQ